MNLPYRIVGPTADRHPWRHRLAVTSVDVGYCLAAHLIAAFIVILAVLVVGANREPTAVRPGPK